jgi:putative addiction module CopG family antidote
MSIVLSSDLETFVRNRVENGRYQNENDVIRAAFSLLERRERLLAHIDEGIGQLQRGEYTDFSEDQQAEFVAALDAASREFQNRSRRE